MPFSYYENLSAAKKRIYRKSDAIDHIPAGDPGRLHPVIIELKRSLEDNKRGQVAKHSSEICRLICDGLGTKPLAVRISTKRPSSPTEELHGLYERTEGETPVLTIWMKTAVKREVVAFKTFMRTLLHELCHHLDYAHFGLEDSFHTEGFFKRESSLYKQILPLELQGREPRKTKPTKKKPPKKNPPKRRGTLQKRKTSEQLKLF
jgi:hypothetical protein